MAIRKIFSKPVDRTIQGVIHVDDLTSLQVELEEYVVTKEVSKGLDALFGSYSDYHGANGVWISGFFGSGKSHLLKMLALLVENTIVNGKSALEYFRPKLEEDALLQGLMEKAAAIPSTSILFNIDQKADTISKTEFDAVLAVFVKVFNEMRGYYGKQGYVAEFERHLDERDTYAAFKEAYKDVAGKEWEAGREQAILEKENISKAYSQATGKSEASTQHIIDEYRETYNLSIEDFAKQVKDFIDRKGNDFRLNFFVDEVGQYVAENVKLMTNLQTVAESLATICEGRSWIFVTAQEDMREVIGEMEEQGNDFSKIQDRFKIRLKLTSANVDEVIQRRLLEKNEDGSKHCQALYDEQKNNLGTLFDFADGSVTYRNFRSVDHFTDCYPFIPYQFTLFQSSIENLSLHNAFEGKHSSVGERSMLEVFQKVVLEISERELGELATFDLMFGGIRSILRAQTQRSILNAEQHLDHELAIRLLKALFLVKYVKEFRATPRNLRVLLQDGFSRDLPGLRREIEEALGILDQETYIQRNGDIYEYLTDEEKDVETEVKNTDVDTGDIAKTLEDILFTEVLGDRKIRYEGTGQDFPFTKKLDDRLIGREQELTIHFVTPFAENVDNLEILKANSLGRAELMIVTPSDHQFVRDLLMYKKTEKYIRLSHSTTQQESIRRILSDRGFQNQERFGQIRSLARELVGRSKVIVSGAEIEVSGEEPRTRVIKGFSDLVVKTYPNLRMLQGVTYREEDIAKYLEISQDSSMFGGDPATFNEAEQEVLAFIQSNNRNGIRSTLKGLVGQFEKRPYGWYLAAIQCNLAKLCGRGKVDARFDGNLLDGVDLERAIRNTHGFPNVVLEPQVEFTASQIRRLKDFYKEFFDQPASSTEAKVLGKETQETFRTLMNELEKLTVQTAQYPFLKVLKVPVAELEEFLSKPYDFYLTDLAQRQDEMLQVKEEVLDPIRRFMTGPNKTTYDDARAFVTEQKPNFASVDSDIPEQILAILEDPDCFRGSQMKAAKDLVEDLLTQIQQLLDAEKDVARRALDELQHRLQGMKEYKALSKEEKETFDLPFERAQSEVQQRTVIAVVRDTKRRFEDEQYAELLGRLAEGPTPVEYVSKDAIRVDFAKPYLENDEDLDSYLDATKSAYGKELKENRRIRI